MSPTFDLSPIGKSNELDGEPGNLNKMVRAFRTNADAISDANLNIQKLTIQGNEMESKAFGALAEKAREIDSGMQKAALRYRLMATAIGSFSSVLREEQSKVGEVLENTRQAQRTEAQAKADYETARSWVRSVDESTREQGLELGDAAASRHASAQSSIAHNKARLLDAITRVREANGTASEKVKNAMESSDLDDSLIDKIVDAGKKVIEAVKNVGKWIWDNLEVITLAVKLIALVTAPIPGVGAVFGAVAAGLVIAVKIKTAITTVKTAVSIVKDVAEGNYSEAGKAALTLGISLVAKKLIGKAAGSVSQRMYSLSKEGVLQSTEAGRQVHQVVMKWGPEMLKDSDPLPEDFASMHINRTTGVINDVVKTGLSHLVKAGKSAVETIGEEASADQSRSTELRPYASVTCGAGGGGW